MPSEKVKKSWWETYRDVIFISMFVSIIILIMVLFDYNYKITVAVEKLWAEVFPWMGVR